MPEILDEVTISPEKGDALCQGEDVRKLLSKSAVVPWAKQVELGIIRCGFI
jgi:hypothetical protein